MLAYMPYNLPFHRIAGVYVAMKSVGLTIIIITNKFTGNPLQHSELIVMEKVMKQIIFYTILALLISTVTMGQNCTKKQEREIEAKAAYFKTWDEVYSAWEAFRQCDDGAIAEGFSESITMILSTQWTEKGKLINLIEKHPNFEKFIIKHINKSVPYDRLSKLGHMAKMRCVDSTHDFCMKILDKATE